MSLDDYDPGNDPVNFRIARVKIGAPPTGYILTVPKGSLDRNYPVLTGPNSDEWCGTPWRGPRKLKNKL